jgi:hypothetical protein
MFNYDLSARTQKKGFVFATNSLTVDIDFSLKKTNDRTLTQLIVARIVQCLTLLASLYVVVSKKNPILLSLSVKRTKKQQKRWINWELNPGPLPCYQLN